MAEAPHSDCGGCGFESLSGYVEDWVDDPDLSLEETLCRFRQLPLAEPYTCQHCDSPFDPIRTRYLCPHCKMKNTCCE